MTFQTRRSLMKLAQSGLSELKRAERRAAALRPLRVRDGVGPIDADRITTLEDCVAGTRKAAALGGHACRHLLLPSLDDPNHYLAQPLFGQARPLGAAYYLCETPVGSVVLSADTLVYWH